MAITTMRFGTDMPYPIDEYQARWERMYNELASRGVETAVIWQRSGGSYDRAGDVHWLANYASLASGQEPAFIGGVGRAFAALVFHARREPTLHIAEPYDMVNRGQIATSDVVAHEHDFPAGVARSLVAAGIDGVVLHNGDDLIPWQHARILGDVAPAIEWRQADDLFWKIHRIKSPREIDRLRETGEVASRALTALMEGLIAGQSESEAAARAAAEIVRAGGGFVRIGAAHGPIAEHVLWSTGLYGFDTRPPQPGDMLRGWVYGPILHGSWIDPGRVAVCGNRPTTDQKRLIEGAVHVCGELVRAIGPGVSSVDVGVLGDRLMEEAGNQADNDRWSLYGHGIGKDFYMTPVIPRLGAMREYAGTYEPGMGFTVELFLRHKGVGLAGLGTTGLVTETGTEMLDTTPMLWW